MWEGLVTVGARIVAALGGGRGVSCISVDNLLMWLEVSVFFKGFGLNHIGGASSSTKQLIVSIYKVHDNIKNPLQ